MKRWNRVTIMLEQYVLVNSERAHVLQELFSEFLKLFLSSEKLGVGRANVTHISVDAHIVLDHVQELQNRLLQGPHLVDDADALREDVPHGRVVVEGRAGHVEVRKVVNLNSALVEVKI